jgi:hypothetical protein
MNHLDKLHRTADDVTHRRLRTNPPPSDSELLRKGLSRQLERLPHSIGDADPDRKRELGEIEIELAPSSEKRRIRVAHDPENGAMHLHGVAVTMSQVDEDLRDSFEATAANLNLAQGMAEQETQRTLLGLVVGAVLRRHKFLADALTRQLDHERWRAV